MELKKKDSICVEFLLNTWQASYYSVDVNSIIIDDNDIHLENQQHIISTEHAEENANVYICIWPARTRNCFLIIC